MPRRSSLASPTRTQQLRDEFVRMIRSGHWSAGKPIPTEMSLIERFGVSRTVVRAALKDLEKRGWVKATRGSGRRVTEHARNWRASIGLLVAGGELAEGQGYRFFTQLEDYVTRHNHVLLTHACRVQEHEQSQDWTAHLNHFDGVIVYSPGYINEPLRKLTHRLPVVCTPHDATPFGVPSFYVDYGLHACLAVDALVRRGHRRIGLLLPAKPNRAMINSTIRRGFDMGRILAGLALDESVILSYSSTITPSEVQRVLDALNDPRQPVTALICRTFTAPLQTLIQAAAAQGDDLPAQRAVICLSDLTHDRQQIKGLAYFRLPIDQITQRAVDVLQNMILGKAPDHLHHPFYGELVDADQLPPPPS